MRDIGPVTFGSVYPLYVAKLERKGHTKAELDAVIEWLTGYGVGDIQSLIASGTTFEQFFAGAKLHENAGLITGVICGVRVEEIADPLMRQVRYLDKLVDEVARGRPLAKVLRS